MSDNQSNFNVSQEFEIIPHQKGKAYPIGVKEWDFIKDKINDVKIDINNYNQIAYLLLGASASCIITIFATKFETDTSKYLVWSIFAITFICGILSLYFSRDKHKQESAKPKEIINHMELIESRFENKKA